MRAQVTKQFPGCTDDNPKTRTILAGEIISGDLAVVAVGNGWAEEIEGDAESSSSDDGGFRFADTDDTYTEQRILANDRIAAIHAEVIAARQAADIEIENIRAEVSEARKSADVELENIKSELDKAKSEGSESDSGATDLEKLTVDELKAYAADKGIDLADAKLKAEIVAVIKAADLASK
ncbi:hypothetical protein ACXHXM_16900